MVLLDVDGTLVPHRLADPQLVSQEAKAKIQELLGQENVIYLISNNFGHSRNDRLAEICGVNNLRISFRTRKPSRSAFLKIPSEHRDRARVVIGDKKIADGLFAERIEARFFQVASKPNTGLAGWLKEFEDRTDDALALLHYRYGERILHWYQKCMGRG